MASAKNFNVGIVGYGLSAKIFHIPFVTLTPSLTLHSIVQRSPSSDGTNSAPHDHPALKHYTSLVPMLADPEVHIVIICTPPSNHFSMARDALEAGKHVVVEKPFVPTSSQALELAALARRKGAVLAVYQNRRWDSDFLTVQRLLAEEKLGRVVEFETHFDRFRLEAGSSTGSKWKAELGMDQGGGVLYDLGTHLVDQVVVLFGVPDKVVMGRLVRQREGRFVSGADGETAEEQPDSMSAILGYESTGMLVYVRIGVVSAEARQPRFWVRGTKGSYVKTGLDPQEEQLRAGGMKAGDEGFGWEKVDRWGRMCWVGEGGKIEEQACPTVEPPETYLRFYELFAKAVETGREEDVPVTADQAASVLRILETVRESARTGREIRLE